MQSSKSKIQVELREKFEKKGEKIPFVKQNRPWNHRCAKKAAFSVKSYGVGIDQSIQGKIREKLGEKKIKMPSGKLEYLGL